MDKLIKENKIFISLVIVLVFILSIYYINNQKNIENDISLQTKCAAAAANYYKPDIVGATSYINHWNKSLSKCFIEVIDLNAYSKDLNDAIEGKSYGTFFHLLDNKYNAPDTCIMRKDGTDNSSKPCYSENEFDNFVNGYMEN